LVDSFESMMMHGLASPKLYNDPWIPYTKYYEH